nr:MAG TPA: hypothetical protein [Caudoviricetes sp.]
MLCTHSRQVPTVLNDMRRREDTPPKSCEGTRVGTSCP